MRQAFSSRKKSVLPPPFICYGCILTYRPPHFKPSYSAARDNRLVTVMKMKGTAACIILSVLMCLFAVQARPRGESVPSAAKIISVARVSAARGEQPSVHTDAGEMRAVWVSQFDQHPIDRSGGRMRSEEDIRSMISTVLDNLARDGFNTILLQIRPNGDSMYESDIYPCSKYVAGVYGGKTECDPVGIFVTLAHEYGMRIHAWINPFRLCTREELEAGGAGQLLQWLGTDRIKEGGDGLLYLDPCYPEATELIASGAKEALQKYPFDGLHIDDYFYPTEFELDDSIGYAKSGFETLADFRRANIDRTVKALYDVAHDEGVIFGAAPAGNLYSLADGWYADVRKWCSQSGYVDYIMPQLYFGFKNAYCPFEKILDDWESAVTSTDVKLYIGLSAAKAALGSEGKADEFAGISGKYEWCDNKDVLAREIASIRSRSIAKGFCIFCYSSMYDPVTGEENRLLSEEKCAFSVLLRGEDG